MLAHRLSVLVVALLVGCAKDPRDGVRWVDSYGRIYNKDGVQVDEFRSYNGKHPHFGLQRDHRWDDYGRSW